MGIVCVQSSCTQVDHEDKWNVLQASATEKLERGDAIKAIPLYQQALAEAETLPNNTTQIEKTLSGLLLADLAVKDYAAAEPVSLKLLKIHESSKGIKAPALKTELVVLAAIYEKLGRYKDQANVLVRLVDNVKGQPKYSRPEASALLRELSKSYQNDGDATKANESRLAAAALVRMSTLDDLKNSSLDQTTDVVTRSNVFSLGSVSMAVVADTGGTISGARLSPYSAKEDAAKIIFDLVNGESAHNTFPNDYQDLVASLDKIAPLSINAESFKTPWLNYGAYRIVVPASGDAILLLKTESYPVIPTKDSGQQVLLIQKQSIAFLQKLLGPKDPSVASNLRELLEMAEATGDYGEAIRLLQQLISSLRSQDASDKIILKRTYNRLADAYRKAGRLADASKADSAGNLLVKITTLSDFEHSQCFAEREMKLDSSGPETRVYSGNQKDYRSSATFEATLKVDKNGKIKACQISPVDYDGNPCYTDIIAAQLVFDLANGDSMHTERSTEFQSFLQNVESLSRTFPSIRKYGYFSSTEPENSETLQLDNGKVFLIRDGLDSKLVWWAT